MTETQSSQKFTLNYPQYALTIFGVRDRHLRMIEDAFDVTVNVRGEQVEIIGSEAAVAAAKRLIQTLEEFPASGRTLGEHDVMMAIKMAKHGQLEQFVNGYDEIIGKTFEGKPIRPKTGGQRAYVQAIKHAAVTFGIGPAGTGKTFLAIVMAVRALKAGEVKRIILTRPAVEAGESLGFLPGDLKEKVDPYLRPVYDALYTIYGVEHTEHLLERNVIEIAPLAYMRGRTLDDAFVVLDEAQNTTIAQMKMFLTRLGFGSKMVVNGDTPQIDLPSGVTSGLIDARHKLQDVDGIVFRTFDSVDVVRHPVVAAIIEAYASHGDKQH